MRSKGHDEYKDTQVRSSEVVSFSKLELHELVEKYASLVKRIAHHMMGRMPPSVSLDDMLQAGMIGLIEASKKYDDSKGASFETYAGIRIRGSMLDEIRKGDWAPRSVHRNSRKVSDAIRRVENKLQRDAKDTDIAAEMGVEIEEYYGILQDSLATKLFSFTELIGETEGIASNSDAPNESSEPLKNLQLEALHGALSHAIKGLPEREKLVLALYYDEELNLKEIGEILGVSESRVSQIHSQAALRLRGRLEGWKR